MGNCSYCWKKAAFVCFSVAGYPTPCIGLTDESLGDMSTPDTPYGRTFYPNPSPRTRKKFKRQLDALPDDPNPNKRHCAPGETPEEVYLKKYAEKMTKFIENHAPPKFPIEALEDDDSSKKNKSAGHHSPENEPADNHSPENLREDHQISENEPTVPADHHGPLYGVVIYVSKKLSDQQQSLYNAVADLGGDFKWIYDNSVTHFIHLGRVNDTNREFRKARDQKKFIVAPDWVWLCRDDNRRIDEALFPHSYNTKHSLSIVTKSCRKSTRSQQLTQSEHKENTILENDPEDESKFDETNKALNENLTKQLEEIENLAAKARRSASSTPKSRSLSSMNKINVPVIESLEPSKPSKYNFFVKFTEIHNNK